MQLNHQEEALAYISLGSNLGHREQLLQDAVSMLHNNPSIDVMDCSSMYETEPVGYVDQAPFLNMVISVNSTLSPHVLLAEMLAVEKNLGRIRDIRWGPRLIDLDLLLYENVEIHTPELIIPHPRMYERCFVLMPLSELMKTEQCTKLDKITQILEKLDRKDGVALWKTVNWHKESGRFVN